MGGRGPDHVEGSTDIDTLLSAAKDAETTNKASTTAVAPEPVCGSSTIAVALKTMSSLSAVAVAPEAVCGLTIVVSPDFPGTTKAYRFGDMVIFTTKQEPVPVWWKQKEVKCLLEGMFLIVLAAGIALGFPS